MWKLGTTRIYVTGFTGGGKQIIARLQPLAGETVQHLFGYEKEIEKISCLVVGQTNLETLRDMKTSAAQYTLSGYGTVYGSYYVSNISWSRNPTVYHTLSDDCTDPLFSVEIELQ